MAKWLRPLPWQLFCTFEFSHSVSVPQARTVFRSYINDLERRLRSPLTFVVGEEKRTATAVKAAAPLHFHALMTSQVELPSEVIRTSWWSYGGRGHDGYTSDVQPYQRGGRGEEYCLKFMNDVNGDWWYRNLGFFLPGMPGPRKTGHKAARAFARFKSRTGNS
jgi:hypothetical protein